MAAVLYVAVQMTAVAAQAPVGCEPAVLTLEEAAERLRVDVRDLERLAEQGKVPARRIGPSWRFDCATLMVWLRGHELRTPLSATEAEAARGSGALAKSAKDSQSAGNAQQADSQKPIGEAAEAREAEDVFLRGQRVLLRPGEVVLDVGGFYAHSGDYALASIGGGSALTTLEQETFATLLLGRIGVFTETELFASTTFFRRDVHQSTGGVTLASSRQSDFGDTHVGVRRTLWREKGRSPDVIVSLHGQIPAGDTPYAAGSGLVFVKSVDPVVLFASVNYLRTFGRETSALATVLPKNRVDVSMGYALALNDTLAISTAASGVFSGSTTLADVELRQPGRFGIRLGLTSWLAKGLYIEPTVSLGLTGPGKSFALGVTMPYTF